jgi:hypothetical protein
MEGDHAGVRGVRPTVGYRGRPLSRRRTLAALGSTGIAALAGCTSLLGRGPEDRVLERYRQGFTAYRDGAEMHNEAVIAYTGDHYGEVVSTLERVIDDLESARGSFEQSREVASEAQLEDAVAIAEAAIRKSRLLIESSRLLADTATGFDTGEYGAAQEAYDAYRDQMAEFNQARIYPPRVLAEQLDTGVFDF